MKITRPKPRSRIPGANALADRAATGQQAACWVAHDRAVSAFYVSNAGSGTVSAFSDPGDGALTSLRNTATDAGTVDASATTDGRYLYVETGINGIVDEYRVGQDASLTEIGSVTVPQAAGGEGIAAS
jgi:6-phosphogluconolactonase (cycloisomerase 2 family)